MRTPILDDNRVCLQKWFSVVYNEIFMQKLLRHLFPGCGAIYLFMCLAGLAGGLWPEWVWPISSDFRPAPLPTLGTLALAQVLFFILAWPVVQFRRAEETSLGWQVIETAGLCFLTIPFYFACSWFGDAIFVDCLHKRVQGRFRARQESWRPHHWLSGPWCNFNGIDF